MNLSTILNALPVIGSAAAKLPEIVDLITAAADTLGPQDATTAKEALADIQADNDEGHARFQAKLAAAAGK